jgi:hypothetical protein
MPPPGVARPAVAEASRANPAVAHPGVVSLGPHPGELDLDAARPRPFQTTFARHAHSPLPHLALAVGGLLALWATLQWARSGTLDLDRRDALQDLNQLVLSLGAVLSPAYQHEIVTTVPRAATLVAVAVAAAALVGAWIGRLGRNVVMGQPSFGMTFALLALPTWFTLPLTLGTFEADSVTRLDALVRFGTALALLAAQFLLIRWVLLNRLWRAGRIPADYASMALWIPELVPWTMLLGSSITTLVAEGESRTGDSPWEPTEAMVTWGERVSAATLVGLGVLLIVVSVRQHLGILRDRRMDAAARSAEGPMPNSTA